MRKDQKIRIYRYFKGTFADMLGEDEYVSRKRRVEIKKTIKNLYLEAIKFLGGDPSDEEIKETLRAARTAKKDAISFADALKHELPRIKNHVRNEILKKLRDLNEEVPIERMEEAIEATAKETLRVIGLEAARRRDLNARKIVDLILMGMKVDVKLLKEGKRGPNHFNRNDYGD